jgi:glutamyl-tRNA(Gln) amidotransferase subunit E
MLIASDGAIMRPPAIDAGDHVERIDYAEVGLIAGLEVHQQLLTDSKMFCHCPAGRYTKTHDGVVLRHMRPTLSELGEYDGTALMEFKTKKNIIYLLHKSNVCTYEMDDTPPFLVNQQALDVAIEQCLMLGCDIVDEVHIARKQYLDGSIPTGFQRTAIVGVNGKLPLRGRPLSILQVSVEEDSCREVQDKGHLIVWRTDRLGMPLIETVTGPDLRTPEEVEEAILLVGRVCRTTGHVRVGMGASRQDVNVSVRGGRRVEIKGVPQAYWARRLVHGEAVRQVNLLQLRDELHRRGFKKRDDVVIEHAEVTYLFEGSAQTFLRREEWARLIEQEGRRPGFEAGHGTFCVRAVKLVGLAGTLNWPTQPDHSFAHELAGRIRVIACLDQQPILLHSEKWPDYVDSQRELRKLKKRLGCGPQDALVVVWGALDDTVTAVEEIRLRYLDALDGVPNETRQPFPDGSTDFERILPGPDRMYPDTDSPPVPMTRERVERLRDALPPPPWIREERYGAAGVARETIYFLIRRGGAAFVDRVVAECGADLRRACRFFGEQLKGLRRVGVPLQGIGAPRWCELFRLLEGRPVLWEVWPRLVVAMATTPGKSLAQVAHDEGLDVDAAGWEPWLDELVSGTRPAHIASDDRTGARQRFYMGQAMQRLRGRVAGRDVARALGSRLALGAAS